MTNKLEISRELAERLHEIIAGDGFHEELELAQLIEKSYDAEKVNNHQMGLVQFVEKHGANHSEEPLVVVEPMAWFTEDHLTDKSATTYDARVSAMWAMKGWLVTPLYTSPPAPVASDVAKAFAKGFNTLETGDGKYKIVMQFGDRDEAWDAYKSLNRMTARPDKVKELNQ